MGTDFKAFIKADAHDIIKSAAILLGVPRQEALCEQGVHFDATELHAPKRSSQWPNYDNLTGLNFISRDHESTFIFIAPLATPQGESYFSGLCTVLGIAVTTRLVELWGGALQIIEDPEFVPFVEVQKGCIEPGSEDWTMIQPLHPNDFFQARPFACYKMGDEDFNAMVSRFQGFRACDLHDKITNLTQQEPVTEPMRPRVKL